MKKLILISTLFFIGIVVKSQTNIYHPFADSNAVWEVSYVCTDGNMCGDWANVKYFYGMDTTIGIYNYKRINGYTLQITNQTCCIIPFGPVPEFIRDDTSAKKVYCRLYSSNTDSLLYDFNLNLGDTLKGILASQCIQYIVTVKLIDSILIGATYRKRINFDTTDHCYNYSIIEGVGGTNGFIGCMYNPMFEGGGSILNCYSENGSTMYNAPCPFTYAIPCDLILSSNNDNNILKIKVFPNPTSEKFTIISQSMELPLKISIYDMLGIKLFESELYTNQTDINLSNLSKGMYLIQVKNNENVLLLKKIVLQ